MLELNNKDTVDILNEGGEKHSVIGLLEQTNKEKTDEEKYPLGDSR